MVRVQKIRVPDTGRLSWIVIDGEHIPVGVVNEYLIYLHRLGRSPNTVRAYAHHLQAYWDFLLEQQYDWRDLEAATTWRSSWSWVRHLTPRAGGGHRSDATINLILRSHRFVLRISGQAWEWRRRSVARAASARRVLAKPFLHHISRTQSLRHAVDPGES